MYFLPGPVVLEGHQLVQVCPAIDHGLFVHAHPGSAHLQFFQAGRDINLVNGGFGPLYVIGHDGGGLRISGNAFTDVIARRRDRGFRLRRSGLCDYRWLRLGHGGGYGFFGVVFFPAEHRMFSSVQLGWLLLTGFAVRVIQGAGLRHWRGLGCHWSFPGAGGHGIELAGFHS